MNPRQKMLWRAASAIAETYARRQDVLPLPAEPLPLDAVARLTRMMRHACRHHYRAASRRLRPRLERALRDLAVTATSQAERLCRERRAGQAPTLGGLYRDLLAIDEEFPQLEINLPQRRLLVATGPITLEGVALGPFLLSLDWGTLGGDQPQLLVIAMEPHAPGSNQSVTHPHVVEDRLCEGEGGPVLQAAALEGRLYDYVLIVRQILQTYNASSAYVDLDRWHGSPCSDCGVLVDDEDRSLCGRCDAEVCDGCSGACEGCGEGLCHGCRGECEGCGEHHCRACLEPCSDCDGTCCYQCLTDGVCDACTAEKESEDEAPPAAAAPVAAADAPRVGQAQVLA
ncbi:hypothetical protein Pla175_24450 [Pirellulimonas nuda]|uniref:Uncharacterized protein n=1 Tax=Pirellulimonas nuda TaxID=2528009 RepID=A0A518DC62_9BACT|nr:hypothetical protein [Pirellulimonas nuda]QDU89059.1 hypothetical protein Pla175_24450 [Pirellulimonas nuda]